LVEVEVAKIVKLRDDRFHTSFVIPKHDRIGTLPNHNRRESFSTKSLVIKKRIREGFAGMLFLGGLKDGQLRPMWAVQTSIPFFRLNRQNLYLWDPDHKYFRSADQMGWIEHINHLTLVSL